MLEIFTILLFLILLSKLVESKINIPFILVIIIFAFMANYFLDLSFLKDSFYEIMYLMLPIILIPDVLGLSTDELKENTSGIFYLAVVAVIVSIAIAVVFTYKINFFKNLEFFHLLLLFTPLMATDVVSVSAIFSKFKIPHKLKLYAEGESLFNDITAMVIFFFIAIPLSQGDDLTAAFLATLTLKIIVFSIAIGVTAGLIGYYLFNISQEYFCKFIVVYLMASVCFLISDELRLSGILSVVIAVIFFKYLFNKGGHYKNKNAVALLLSLTTQEGNLNFRAYIKESQYIGFFANAVIFISIATVIELESLWRYKAEILYVFILTTVIRYLVLSLFIIYKKYPLRWLNILTLGGMKGGLALIMIVSLNDKFVYKEMLVTIVLGVVILSIFIYTILLIIYLFFEKDDLKLDKATEYNIIVKDIKDLLKKEPYTGAYNEIIFEELVEKEISRAQRYNQQFLLVGFQADKSSAKNINNMIRKSDYFGKIDFKYYAVLLPNTSLDDIMQYTKRVQKIIGKNRISIAQYSIGDTKTILYEKLLSGFKHKNKIGIEV
ncbi:sodium/proton antiporter, CPA1 family [Hydrogenimonas thermophila]|uniref:Sodium/proton antiporter, CPA1 family n=1 Tax=Hydrogenimonas thermophila TaxID=223786 RepID=A0A1I5PFM7_9BACT|nr:cation:proton antiporter [Hydrogenimonas thermophila]SFP32803.1 sodium/proton antiporter, CPA1 family [Hydrogenimonas thermophila]